jgi:putative lipoprotein
MIPFARGLAALALLSLATGGAQAIDMGEVTGIAVVRERMQLPPGAVFEATLEDVSRADAAADVIATQTIYGPRTSPIRFSLRYHPASIDERHAYAVRVRITADGKLMFVTDQNFPVITRGAPKQVEIVLKHVAGAQDGAQAAGASGATPLENTYWRLTEVAGKPVAAPAAGQPEAHLRLTAQDKRLQGNTGCNSMTGGYTLEGDSLRFTQIASTLRMCADTAAIETAFTKSLGETTDYRLSGDHLELRAGERVLAKLTAVPGR